MFGFLALLLSFSRSEREIKTQPIDYINVHSTLFRNINISGQGGAIYSSQKNSLANISDCVFDTIQASKSGGAIFISGKVDNGGKHIYEGNCFVRCTAVDWASAVQQSSNRAMYMTTCSFFYSQFVGNGDRVGVIAITDYSGSADSEGIITQTNISRSYSPGQSSESSIIRIKYSHLFTTSFMTVNKPTGFEYIFHYDYTGHLSKPDSTNMIGDEESIVSLYHYSGTANFTTEFINGVVFGWTSGKFVDGGPSFNLVNCLIDSRLTLSDIKSQGQVEIVSATRSRTLAMINSKFNDQCGFPTMSATFSDVFTASEGFTASTIFTASEEFTPSLNFTASEEFSASENFTASSVFTASKVFTASEEFTPSLNFTASEAFTPSLNFTASEAFTPSLNFTASEGFTASTIFTASEEFTPSIGFTASEEFTQTSYFSPSSEFTKSAEFSSSSMFTQSYDFTPSVIFSDSNTFTPSATLDLREWDEFMEILDDQRFVLF